MNTAMIDALHQDDPYKGIADRYDLSFGPFGEQDPQMAGFLRQVFTQNNVYTILDCACGTGRHLPLFHTLGCEVYGSDISETMLAQARKNLAGCGLGIPLVQADFRDLPRQFPQPFDAVICLGAIGFMPGETEFKKAFKSMAQVLRPGGILVLTAMPTDQHWKEKPRFLLTSNRSDFPGFSPSTTSKIERSSTSWISSTVISRASSRCGAPRSTPF